MRSKILSMYFTSTNIYIYHTNNIKVGWRQFLLDGILFFPPTWRSVSTLFPETPSTDVNQWSFLLPPHGIFVLVLPLRKTVKVSRCVSIGTPFYLDLGQGCHFSFYHARQEGAGDGSVHHFRKEFSLKLLPQLLFHSIPSHQTQHSRSLGLKITKNGFNSMRGNMMTLESMWSWIEFPVGKTLQQNGRILILQYSVTQILLHWVFISRSP